MEKWEKNHLLWEISRGGTSTKQSGTGTGTDTHALFGQVLVFWPYLAHLLFNLSESSFWLN